ncbi:MAG: DUF3576 domain-containing protein [Pseudomonadota bacterium]
MSKRLLALALAGALTVTACGTFGGGGKEKAPEVTEIETGVNRYLWRASLDTLSYLPIESADPYTGLILYNWRSFEEAPNERVKATVFILDTRLRADGVKVQVFRQVKDESGDWVDADVNAATPVQLENKILTRARNIKAGELG